MLGRYQLGLGAPEGGWAEALVSSVGLAPSVQSREWMEKKWKEDQQLLKEGGYTDAEISNYYTHNRADQRPSVMPSAAQKALWQEMNLVIRDRREGKDATRDSVETIWEAQQKAKSRGSIVKTGAIVAAVGAGLWAAVKFIK